MMKVLAFRVYDPGVWDMFPGTPVNFRGVHAVEGLGVEALNPKLESVSCNYNHILAQDL